MQWWLSAREGSLLKQMLWRQAGKAGKEAYSWSRQGVGKDWIRAHVRYLEGGGNHGNGTWLGSLGSQAPMLRFPLSTRNGATGGSWATVHLGGSVDCRWEWVGLQRQWPVGGSSEGLEGGREEKPEAGKEKEQYKTVLVSIGTGYVSLQFPRTHWSLLITTRKLLYQSPTNLFPPCFFFFCLPCFFLLLLILVLWPGMPVNMWLNLRYFKRVDEVKWGGRGPGTHFYSRE